jgi:hypothetical protein
MYATGRFVPKVILGDFNCYDGELEELIAKETGRRANAPGNAIRVLKQKMAADNIQLSRPFGFDKTSGCGNIEHVYLTLGPRIPIPPRFQVDTISGKAVRVTKYFEEYPGFCKHMSTHIFRVSSAASDHHTLTKFALSLLTSKMQKNLNSDSKASDIMEDQMDTLEEKIPIGNDESSASIDLEARIEAEQLRRQTKAKEKRQRRRASGSKSSLSSSSTFGLVSEQKPLDLLHAAGYASLAVIALLFIGAMIISRQYGPRQKLVNQAIRSPLTLTTNPLV